MNTLISFQGLQGFSHHHDFINSQLAHSVGKFRGRRPITAHVHISESAPRKNFREPEFTCEIVADVPGFGHTLVAKKVSENFQTAVRQAVKAIAHGVSKMVHKRVARRNDVSIKKALTFAG